MAAQISQPPLAQSDDLSKQVLDWSQRIAALGVALTTVAGALLPEDQVLAKQIAFGLALLLVPVIPAAVWYRRRRAAATATEPLPESEHARATLRFLFPFEDGDPLPGRADDVRDLYTMVASAGFRFGVLTGPSGCGKTSLLRAGLIPRLRERGFLPLYVPRVGDDPRAAICAALAATRPPDAPACTAAALRDFLRATAREQAKTLVVVCDQFEDFFLTTPTQARRGPFIRWVGDCVEDPTLPVAFLFSLRSDFYIRIRDFARHVPEPMGESKQYELQNFDPAQAERVLRTMAKLDGVDFEPDLIEAVVEDLTVENAVRPAELQLVATRLKRRRISTADGYRAAGEVRGLLSSYIGDAIDRAADPPTARLVLRSLLPAEGHEGLAEPLSLDQIARSIGSPGGASGPAGRDEVKDVLAQFVDARVVLQVDGDQYKLVHDYLVPLVARATERDETLVERADRLLRQYVAAYKEDESSRIPLHKLRWINRHASPEHRAAEPARALLRKSTQALYASAARLAGSTLLLMGATALVASGPLTPSRGWEQINEVKIPAMPNTLAIQPGTERIVTAGPAPGGLFLWNARTNDPAQPLPQSANVESTAVAFSPDGARLASGGRHGGIQLWDTTTWAASDLRPPRKGARPGFENVRVPCAVRFLKFSLDGKLLSSGDDCGLVQLWDVESGSSIDARHARPIEPYPELVDLHPDGRRLAIFDRADSVVTVLDLGEQAATSIPVRFGSDKELLALKFGPGGSLLAGVASGSAFELIDLGTGATLDYRQELPDPAEEVIFSGDGRTVGVKTAGGTFCVWNRDTGHMTDLEFLSGHARGALSEDGKLLVTSLGVRDRRFERGTWFRGRSLPEWGWSSRG